MSTISWRSAVSGKWGYGSNWNWGLAPTASDGVLIALPGAFAVTIDGPAVASSLSFALGPGVSANRDGRSGKLLFAQSKMGLALDGESWTTIDVEAGATLDLGGSPTSVALLTGAGTLMASNAIGENLTVGGGQFGG